MGGKAVALGTVESREAAVALLEENGYNRDPRPVAGAGDGKTIIKSSTLHVAHRLQGDSTLEAQG